jgi:hypothetical protein
VETLLSAARAMEAQTSQVFYSELESIERNNAPRVLRPSLMALIVLAMLSMLMTRFWL